MSEIGGINKTQLQNGGSKEISVDGLAGLLADGQTPLAHKTSHQNGGSDQISLAGLTAPTHKATHQNAGSDEIDLTGLAGMIAFTPYNGKIADITHADTSSHTINIQTQLSETRTIIAALIWVERISGTGALKVYPNAGTFLTTLNGVTNMQCFPIPVATQLLTYQLQVVNDDFDLYCAGYFYIST